MFTIPGLSPKQSVEALLLARKQYEGKVNPQYIGDFLGFLMANVPFARKIYNVPTDFTGKSWKYRPMYHGRTLWSTEDHWNYSVTRIIQIRRKYLEAFLDDRRYDRCGCSYDCCGHWFAAGTEVLYKQGRFAYLRVTDSRNY